MTFDNSQITSKQEVGQLRRADRYWETLVLTNGVVPGALAIRKLVHHSEMEPVD